MKNEGLIDPPSRNTSGYRAYNASAVRRLTFIKRAQSLGFTLKEIRALMTLQSHRDAECEGVRRVAEAKLKVIDQKIAGLSLMRGSLAKLAESCTGLEPTHRCEIVECLAGEDRLVSLS